MKKKNKIICIAGAGIAVITAFFFFVKNIKSNEQISQSETAIESSSDNFKESETLSADKSESHDKYAEYFEDGNSAIVPKEEISDEDGRLHTSDTVYSEINSDMPVSVYTYTFEKDPDNEIYGDYVNNKNTLQMIDDDLVKDIEKTASDYAENVFNIDYRKIQKDSSSYTKKLTDMYMNVIFTADDPDYDPETDDGAVIMTPDMLMEKLTDWIIKNEVISGAEFKTDRSLIWQDNGSFYVRGILTLKPKSCKDESGTSYYFPIDGDISFNGKGEYVVDIPVDYHKDGATDGSGRKFIIIGGEIEGKV